MTEPSAQAGGSRDSTRRLGWSLRVIVTLGGLLFLGSSLDVASVAGALSGLEPRAVILVLLLSILSVVVSAWRWQRVLVHAGEHCDFRRLLGDSFVACCYNLLLPTAVGGDVVRGVRLAPRLKNRPTAYASVVFERLMGVCVLVLLALVGLLVTPTGSFEPTGEFVLSLTMLALMVLAAIAVLLDRMLRYASGPLQRFPRIVEVGRILKGPLAKPSPLVETLSWSLLFQLVSLSILTVSGLVTPTSSTLIGVYFGVPLALVVASLPVSIGGHGVRESMFIVLLGFSGIDAARAFALSMVWLGSSLTVAAVGLLVLLGERVWHARRVF